MSDATLLTLVRRMLSKVKELLGISQRDSFPRTLAILAQYPICPEVVGYFLQKLQDLNMLRVEGEPNELAFVFESGDISVCRFYWHG
jgi:hypothetical protein